MTTGKQIIAIAELDGWTNLHLATWDCEIGDEPVGYPPTIKGDCGSKTILPVGSDYLHSRDAIVSVIERQPMHVQIDFIKHLHRLVNSSPSEIVKDLFCFTAKVELVAEALLRATGKWSEE